MTTREHGGIKQTRSGTPTTWRGERQESGYCPIADEALVETDGLDTVRVTLTVDDVSVVCVRDYPAAESDAERLALGWALVDRLEAAGVADTLRRLSGVP